MQSCRIRCKTRQQNFKHAYLNTLAPPTVIQQQEETIRSKKTKFLKCTSTNSFHFTILRECQKERKTEKCLIFLKSNIMRIYIYIGYNLILLNEKTTEV